MNLKSLAYLLICLFCFTNCKKNDTPTINYKQEMRLLVQEISAYSKNLDKDFIVIPHNGQELVTKNGKIDSSPASDYLAAIDAIGRDGVFYGFETLDEETATEEQTYLINFLDFAKDRGLTILVTDFCNTPEKMDSSYIRNQEKGYLSFAADQRSLDNIPEHPSPILNENNAGIKGFSVRNFLYLPNHNFLHKNLFINAIQNTNYDLLITKPKFGALSFDKKEMDQLKEKKNRGLRKIFAYVNIGEAYHGQTYWEQSWKDFLYGNDASYLKNIIDQGFDGVYLDGVEMFKHFE